MKTCVVTGGGGFLGKALCKRLLKEGYRVISLARGRYPELEECGVISYQVDITNLPSTLRNDLVDVYALFHVAAKVEMWGKYEDFVKVNVEGTRSLLNLCEACGIPHFIYTSSPSVVADGTNLRGVDESYPYPVRWKAYYPETKALAEQDVLTRAKAGRIKALSLRPHLIFGPGDTSLTATVIDKAKRGKLVQVGDGKNIVDFTHIEDCITAHVLALKSLENGNASNGKPYFISQGDPVPMWEWIQRVLSYHNLQPPQRTISKDAAYAIASMSEYASTLLPWLGPPPFTRFLVSEMSTDHYFNISAARNDLGYSPPYSVWDRLAQTFEK